MFDTKLWWQSRGIWGSLAGMGAGMIEFWRGAEAYFTAHPDQQITLMHAGQLVWQNASSIFVIGAAFISWYGRWKATAQIGDKPL